MIQKKATAQYMDGVYHGDPNLVRTALANGADIDAPYPTTNYHALDVVLLDSAYLYTGKTQQKERRHADLKIAHLIIDAHPNLTSKRDIDGFTLLDRILCGAHSCHRDTAWVDAAARAVIESLFQDAIAERPAYKPDMDLLFSAYGGEDTDPQSPRHTLAYGLTCIHKRVQKRLTCPKNIQEIFLAKHKEHTRYWRNNTKNIKSADYAYPDREQLSLVSHFRVKCLTHARKIKNISPHGTAHNIVMKEKNNL